MARCFPVTISGSPLESEIMLFAPARLVCTMENNKTHLLLFSFDGFASVRISHSTSSIEFYRVERGRETKQADVPRANRSRSFSLSQSSVICLINIHSFFFSSSSSSVSQTGRPLFFSLFLPLCFVITNVSLTVVREEYKYTVTDTESQ